MGGHHTATCYEGNADFMPRIRIGDVFYRPAIVVAEQSFFNHVAEGFRRPAAVITARNEQYRAPHLFHLNGGTLAAGRIAERAKKSACLPERHAGRSGVV